MSTRNSVCVQTFLDVFGSKAGLVLNTRLALAETWSHIHQVKMTNHMLYLELLPRLPTTVKRMLQLQCSGFSVTEMPMSLTPRNANRSHKYIIPI